MDLTLWTYEGPPHVGAMRIAASMEGVHYVLHAPQGDTYADLLFTMIERRDRRPPVTYTTFQARDLGGDTAELVKRSIADAVARFEPEALLVGESCTAELIQDDPAGLAEAIDTFPVDAIKAACDRVLTNNAKEALQYASSEGFAPLREEWDRHHVYRGKPVRLTLPDAATIDGVARGVDENGALLLDTSGGVRRVHSGDVSLRGMHAR